MAMTPDAKRQLSATIRELRTRLLEDLHASTESTYRLAVLRAQDAGLAERPRSRRKRLEVWIDGEVRADKEAGKQSRDAAAFGKEAEKQAAYTLLNRLVILRILETRRGKTQRVITGGWDSVAYKNFRELASALVRGDETESYAFLLQLVFEDLATELPGLFGPAGVADLIPVSAATLRHVIERLDDPGLASCWTDDMTLGWVYQYWNDPEREALDAKLNGGGKIEPHEIASKTQMFTERYMVDWLLQNSLGPMWLAMCKRHGWTPEAESSGTLGALEARRAEWRKKREAGEVSLAELMPLHSEEERRWAYYVPQSLPGDAVERAPETVRDLKILDPAVGSGHFLVVAFELLVALYREEARHRGEADLEQWSDRRIVERILEHNLHGIDLDPRAVQIAAAALWLKAKGVCAAAEPKQMNLVASCLRLGNLRDDDPALVELRREVQRETGIPAELTDKLVHALKGADHLGSLLKVDAAVDDAIREYEEKARQRAAPQQVGLFGGAPEPAQMQLAAEATRQSVLERLEAFLQRHTAGDDLGLRLRGEQLARGVRFVRMVREGSYDLVVGNPPYQGTTKLASAGYLQSTYPRGKADLYAAFLERGLHLVREGGTSALLTMRNWMFIKQYEALRTWLLESFDLRALGDFAIGAFDEVPNDLLSVVVSVFRRVAHAPETSAAQQPTPPDDLSYDRERTRRKRAAVLCQAGRYAFDPAALRVVPEWPLVYWWTAAFLARYRATPLVGDIGAVRQGLTTSNNDWFVRYPWEIAVVTLRREFEVKPQGGWVPYIKGARGVEWVEPVSFVVDWRAMGLAIKVLNEWIYNSHTRSVRSEDRYFDIGSAFTTMGARFGGRSHRFRSICDAKGRTVYGLPHRDVTCLLNSMVARRTVESLNPTIDFSVGDVNRLPMFSVSGSNTIFDRVEEGVAKHESHREPSVEFKCPGPSPWRYAQDWAQAAVDRSEGASLPTYEPVYDPEPATDHLSFALGVALGRFGANGEGILDPATADLSGALPHGILFLDGTLDENDDGDGLGHAAAAPLRAAWAEHGAAIDAKSDLREWLRHRFFPDVHKGMYENRPIHWPLSSEKRTFVAWINIHRWTLPTLTVLLGDLQDALKRIEGALVDLRATRDGADKKAAKAAEKDVTRLLAARDELTRFVESVRACADRGPPPPDSKCPRRDADARYAPDLDDGVMINSAALWPLLDPQWKDPKKWWVELATAKDKKDYDWSHLAMRYWPDRVDRKCQDDPSLAVAHGCFWRYHPKRAYAWELRLQDEIAPDFRISESPYRGDAGDGPYRQALLRDHPRDALDIVEREALRRLRKGKSGKAPADALHLLDPGLWAALPGDCWDLELKLAKKLYREVWLRAPDEPAARAAFETTHPRKVAERKKLISELETPPELFASSELGDAADDASEDDPEEAEV